MGIDHTAGEPGKKLRAKNFHEAGRHHPVRLVCRGGVGDRRVPRVAVGVVAQPHLVARHRRRRRDVDGAAVAVDADRDHAGRVVADRGLEQGLQQRTGARGQHHQPRRCARGHTERLLHAPSLIVGRRGSGRQSDPAWRRHRRCIPGPRGRAGRPYRVRPPWQAGTLITGAGSSSVGSSCPSAGSLAPRVRGRARRRPLARPARAQAFVEIDVLADYSHFCAQMSVCGATMPPAIATVSPPIPTNHRNTAGPNVAWSTPTSPKLPSWPPPA